MKVKRTKVTVLKTRGTNPARRICPYNYIGKMLYIYMGEWDK